MKTKHLFLYLFILCSHIATCAPKKIKVSNAAQKTVKICIYMGKTSDEIGQAVGEFKSLAPGTSYVYEYNYKNGNFIHTILFLDNDDKVVINTFQASSDDNKEVTVNVSSLQEKAVDRSEIERMKKLVENEVVEFKKTYKFCIRVEGDISSGLQEYLGAIAIIDTSQKDFRSSIKLIYYGRQLGISENPPLSGRSFQETFKITKQYAAEASINIPTAFSSNIDYSNGDLQEVSLSCKAIGTVLLPTRPGITPIGLLLDFDDKSAENIVGTITETLHNCQTCILQQVQGVLAHSGIAVNVKRFKKSNLAIANSATNLVTANGTFTYENGYDYFDIIAPRVIALGFSDISLKINFSQTVLEKLNVQKRDVENLITDRQSAIGSLRTQLASLNEIIVKLENFR